MTKKETVEVVIDLGDLKPMVQKVAKKSGVSMNEFICDAVESQVRRDRDYESDSFVRHGGKHRMGKDTGYEVTKDGRYYPAPAWTQQFEQLFAERQAIHSLANSIVAQLQERLIGVEKHITQAKDRLIDDIGLDPSKLWTFYGGEQGYLKEGSPEREAETQQ